MTNSSGIFPSGDRVLIRPDDIEKKTKGGIIIAETIAEQHQNAQSTGVLVAVGPDAFTHQTTLTERFIDGSWKPVERTTTGYSGPFANIGDRVAFAKYGGLQVEGEDGVVYRVMNDEDITARVSRDVEFTDIKSRKPVSQEA